MYTMKYSLAIKGTKYIDITVWMDLKVNMLSEKSLKSSHTYLMIPFI